ncbi:MAG: Phosphate transport system permease protein PstC [Syntrophomonadaceae bacterium]|nr:Phosphate transport system permease protein PstC [Bacillota bacterium]
MYRYYKERIIETVLIVSALAAILVIGFITIIIFNEGLPIITKVGPFNFILGVEWSPLAGIFGIAPMIVGTFFVVSAAMLLGVPLGIACAIFLAEIAPKRIRSVIRPSIELLLGIPSVVYGFFGLVILVPIIREHFGGPGFSILAGSIILAIMLLPTVIVVSEDAIRSVKRTYKEASLALGATHWQTIRNVILPAARSGITAGVILGFGRAISETMAVIMVLGNAPIFPRSLLDPVRALTANIALEMAYATGDHRQALFATGIILFVVILLSISLINIVQKRDRA